MNSHILFLLCVLVAGCGTVSDSSSGSSNSGATGSFSQSDLGGDWLGRLTPDHPGEDARLFYFSAAANGDVEEAADSVANKWFASDANIEQEFLSSGKLLMRFSYAVGPRKLRLRGSMNNSRNIILGEYSYENNTGVWIVGTFELMRSSGENQFKNIDLSGSWSDGMGVNGQHRERLLTFELDQEGNVISGLLVNTITGFIIHEYSAGAGSFVVSDTATGRINDFHLVADDGSIASSGFLLVDIDLGFIAGTCIDSDAGVAVIQVRR